MCCYKTVFRSYVYRFPAYCRRRYHSVLQCCKGRRNSLRNISHDIFSLAAILFFTALYLKLTDKRKSMPKILSSADKATFPVYLRHCLFIFILNSEFNKYGINDIGIRLVLRFVIVYIVSFGGAILWQWVKNKIDSTAKLKY